MTACRVVMWRHGQTRWNVERRFQGRTDVPLDEVGEAQAERAAERLAMLNPSAIVSSPLQRALTTAEALAKLTGLKVSTDERLCERHGGEWEGLTGDEIYERYPERWAIWQPPGGETEEEVGARVVAAVSDAVDELPRGRTLVVAGHGAATRIGLAQLLEMPIEYADRLGPLSNCAWSVLGEMPTGRKRVGWRLLEHNAGTLPEPALSDDR